MRRAPNKLLSPMGHRSIGWGIGASDGASEHRREKLIGCARPHGRSGRFVTRRTHPEHPHPFESPLGRCGGGGEDPAAVAAAYKSRPQAAALSWGPNRQQADSEPDGQWSGAAPGRDWLQPAFPRRIHVTVAAGAHVPWPGGGAGARVLLRSLREMSIDRWLCLTGSHGPRLWSKVFLGKQFASLCIFAVLCRQSESECTGRS